MNCGHKIDTPVPKHNHRQLKNKEKLSQKRLKLLSSGWRLYPRVSENDTDEKQFQTKSQSMTSWE